MTHLPPDDDLPPPPSYPHEQEEAQEDPADFPYAQEPSQEHAFQSHESSRESSGFGFIALIAGLLCLAALSGIVIYSLLLAPSPPRQPILIEAEGTTKQAPAEAQVKPEPNSNVGVFRMLRGTDQDQQNADATQPWGQIPQNADKNTPLVVKPDAPQETDADDGLDESNTEAEQQQTEKSSQGSNEGNKEKTGEKTPPKEPSDKQEGEEKRVAKTQRRQSSRLGKTQPPPQTRGTCKSPRWNLVRQRTRLGQNFTTNCPSCFIRKAMSPKRRRSPRANAFGDCCWDRSRNNRQRRFVES